MSQGPVYPGRPAGEQPPWPSQPRPQGAPPPGWTPPSLGGQGIPGDGGRRPTDPFGRPALQPVNIGEFAPPRSRLPLVLTALVLVVLAVVVLSGVFRTMIPAVTPTLTPTPSASATSARPGLPFTTPDERYWGRWEILDHRWTRSGLMVEIRIHVDNGPLGYSFMAFENQGAEVINPSPGADSPPLTGASIPTGGIETGWVYFVMDRGDSTIILADEDGKQMSALVIKG